MPTNPPAKRQSQPEAVRGASGTDGDVHAESHTVTQDGWTVTVTSRTETRTTSSRSEERRVTVTRRAGRGKPGK